MKGKRRQHSPEFKAKVALAAIKEDRTATQLASEFAITPLRVGKGKKSAIAALGGTGHRGTHGRPLPADRATQSRVGLA